MSHRRVKAVDSQHDSSVTGADEFLEDEDEVSPELREQLKHACLLVESRLADEMKPEDLESLPEHAIDEAVWYYYGDVDKSAAYLLKKYSKSSASTRDAPKETKKKKGKSHSSMLGAASGTAMGLYWHRSSYQAPECSGMSAAEFFKDSPWLNVPLHRRGEILVEPLYPRGGLLGGSPEASGGKVSKLAALAAARKQKEKAKAQEGNPEDAPAAAPPKQYPRRPKREEPAPAPKPQEETPPEPELPPEPERPAWKPDELIEEPSAFAQAVFDPAASPEPEAAPESLLSYASEPNFAKWIDHLGPSPDDKVAAAQSSAGKGSRTVKKGTGPKPAEDKLSSSVASLSVQDTKAAFKNIDVPAEYAKLSEKKTLNFVVIGHVDAGKSTLMGRLLYDLGEVDERSVERLRKEAASIGKASFALAWVMDQSTEERNRGVTIDYATNKFETPNAKFTILDAPGHRDFIPNMIAGASMADFALLVIDASTGEFESGFDRGGQTKEHALLVRSMGVQRIVVAVNKLDTVQWSEERYREIETQLTAFLTTAGLQQKKLSFIPCSGLTGDNIVHRAKPKEAQWYTGPLLVEQLENSTPLSRAVDKPLRMTIDNIFRGSIQNPLSVSGRISAGNLQIGEALITMPSGETAFVKGIEIDNEPKDWAVAGQNAVLHLTDIEQSHLRGGDVLCHKEDAIVNSKKFTMKLLAFDHLTPMFVDILHSRLYSSGKIKTLVGTLDKANGNVVKKKPKIVAPGAVARVVVEVDEALPIEPPMRIVLRAHGATVGAGLVESAEA